VCCAKAQHTRVNWQDEPLARTWDRDAKVLETAARKVGGR
jgi:hypothetical protein